MKFNGATFNKAQQDQLKLKLKYIKHTFNAPYGASMETVYNLLLKAQSGKRVYAVVDNRYYEISQLTNNEIILGTNCILKEKPTGTISTLWTLNVKVNDIALFATEFNNSGINVLSYGAPNQIDIYEEAWNTTTTAQQYNVLQ